MLLKDFYKLVNLLHCQKCEVSEIYYQHFIRVWIAIFRRGLNAVCILFTEEVYRTRAYKMLALLPELGADSEEENFEATMFPKNFGVPRTVSLINASIQDEYDNPLVFFDDTDLTVYETQTNPIQ